MTVVLLLNGVELKEWLWLDVNIGFSEEDHQNLERHIKAATAWCSSEISCRVDLTKCTWCVKINSVEKLKRKRKNKL